MNVLRLYLRHTTKHYNTTHYWVCGGGGVVGNEVIRGPELLGRSNTSIDK
jgi:hypothetical protein